MFKLKKRDNWFTVTSFDGSSKITFPCKMSLEKVLKHGCQGLKCGRVNAQLWVHKPRWLITNDEQLKQHREKLLVIMTIEESYTEAMKEDNRKAELRLLERQAEAAKAQADAKIAEANLKAHYIELLRSVIENSHCDENTFKETTAVIKQLSITSGQDNETMQSTL